MRVGGWMDGWIDGWIDGWMECRGVGGVHMCTHDVCGVCVCVRVCVCVCARNDADTGHQSVPGRERDKRRL